MAAKGAASTTEAARAAKLRSSQAQSRRGFLSNLAGRKARGAVAGGLLASGSQQIAAPAASILQELPAQEYQLSTAEQFQMEQQRARLSETTLGFDLPVQREIEEGNIPDETIEEGEAELEELTQQLRAANTDAIVNVVRQQMEGIKQRMLAAAQDQAEERLEENVVRVGADVVEDIIEGTEATAAEADFAVGSVLGYFYDFLRGIVQLTGTRDRLGRVGKFLPPFKLSNFFDATELIKDMLIPGVVILIAAVIGTLLYFVANLYMNPTQAATDPAMQQFAQFAGYSSTSLLEAAITGKVPK